MGFTEKLLYCNNCKKTSPSQLKIKSTGVPRATPMIPQTVPLAVGQEKIESSPNRMLARIDNSIGRCTR